MNCINQVQANRVANAGFNKMKEEGNYSTFAPFGDATHWGVCTNDGKKQYRVDVLTDGMTCTCKFYEENEQFGVCKHIRYVQDELSTLAQETEWEEREQARIDAGYDFAFCA